ncbi:MAG: saccharopine dehydrogenase NADP-binding domain-containing protein [Nitrospirae bacterium]|nr:saccharopine dehydrogenase NADP-binding domain-containing protein [Nitrospirota bacterium]
MVQDAKLMIYGAYGYTGDLIARHACSVGLKPTLAGRDDTKLRSLAKELDVPWVAFGLEDAGRVAESLKGIRVVIHAAGPFSHTAGPMAGGCIRAGAHYLDITGEIEVFESLARDDAEAKKAGVMLMPGVGFDVVPSDCLARHLKNRLPTATHLTLAFQGLSGGFSRGTATTMAENIHRGGAIRKDSKVTPVPAGWKTKKVDFGRGRSITCVSIPWGDVSTAFHSTGIPNIEVYAAFPAGMRWGMVLSRPIAGLLGSAPVQKFLKGQIRKRPSGPSARAREEGISRLWGEAVDAKSGRRISARMQTREGYLLTALTAVRIAQKVLAGKAPVGFQTPAKAYGADLILEIEGSVRTDVGSE